MKPKPGKPAKPADRGSLADEMADPSSYIASATSGGRVDFAKIRATNRGRQPFSGMAGGRTLDRTEKYRAK
jgi:hypothetical protein